MNRDKQLSGKSSDGSAFLECLFEGVFDIVGEALPCTLTGVVIFVLMLGVYFLISAGDKLFRDW